MTTKRRIHLTIRFSLLVAGIGLLVLIAPQIIVQATDPPVSPGRWINYGAGTPNFPSGFTITSQAVDNQERLWIGTDGGGIAVFDGIAWTRYTTSDGLVSNNVRSVTARSTSIWISTASGVSVYNSAGDSWTTYTTADDLPSNIVNAVAFKGAPFNSILYATAAGLAECVFVFPSGQSCTVFTSSNSDLADTYVHDVTLDGNGDIWVVTYGGVNRLSGTTWTTHTPANTPDCDVIDQATTVLVDKANNHLWFGTDRSENIDSNPGSGLCMLDTGTGTWQRFYTGNSGLGDDTVKGMALDTAGRLWIATDPENVSDPGGVYVCNWVEDACFWQSYTTTDGLSSNKVHSVAANLDRVWFGTEGGGLSSLALNWANFDNEVLTLANQPGQLWAGTTAGLDHFDGLTWNTEFASAEVRAVLPLAEDSVWVGTNGDGLRHWDGATWQTLNTANSGLVSDAVLALTRDELDRIWVGTDNAGVSVYDPVSDAWTTFDSSNTPLAADHVAALTVDTLGDIWIGTNNGLSQFTGSTWITHTITGGLPSDVIQGLAPADLGQIWAATLAGVAHWDGNVWTSFTTSNGLPSNDARAVTLDTLDRVWAATAAGAAVYDGSDWTAYRARNSGLTNEQVHTVTSDDDGGVWFGATSYMANTINVAGGVFVRSIITETLGLPSPTITSFSPISGPVDTLVTVEGTNFGPGPAVEFKAKGFGHWIQATVVSIADTSLTARVPSEAIQGRIRVHTGAGAAESDSDFNPTPTIIGFSPSAGVVGSVVGIYGSNLDGPTFDEVRFGDGDFDSLPVTFQRHDYIVTHVPADGTTGNIQVRTASGAVSTTEVFTVSDGGIKIFDWEVHQGLPDYPLVAGKSTVVRVFVGTDDPGGLPAYVDRAVLQVLPQGGSTPKGYIATLGNGGIPQALFGNTVQLFSNDGSIDFVIPGEDLPANTYIMGVALSAGFVNLPTQELGEYGFTETGDLRIHISAPGQDIWDDVAIWGPLTDNQMAWNRFSRQLDALSRVYPVRDGIGDLGSENGLQYYLNTAFQLCNGVDDGVCKGEGFEWDFWQENINGVERLCVVPNILKNATDDGSIIGFDLGNVRPASGGSRPFLAFVKPGVTLPADLGELVSLTTVPSNLSASINPRQTLVSSCGSFTPGNVIQFVLNYSNQTAGSVEAQVSVDYDETLIDTSGPGAMVLGSDDTLATYHVPGRFFIPEGSRGAKYDQPFDLNSNGQIDSEDLGKFVMEFESWDEVAGSFAVSTDLSQVKPLDIIRNFRDENDNGNLDDGEPVGPYLVRADNVDDVVYAIPQKYMSAHNEIAPAPAQFSQLWLWDKIDPFNFRALAGQAPGGVSLWAHLDTNNTVIHELGHNTGLSHAPDRRVPNTVMAGYNTQSAQVIVPPNLFSGMGDPVIGPVEQVFFDPNQYFKVYNYFRQQATSGLRLMADAGPIYQISGQLYQNDQLDVGHSSVADSLPLTAEDLASEYSLRFLADDQILAEHRFPVDFSIDHHPLGEPETDSIPILIAQPFPASTTAVEIWHGPTQLLRQEVSATPPTVQVIAPNGGEVFTSSGVISITWTSSDDDGDSLNHAVRYSADGGATWHILAPTVTGNGMAISLKALPGGANILVEVEANDGFHTTADRSDALFSVGEKPPLWAAITAPGNGQQFIQSEIITLNGSGYDLEDGLLSGSALTWASDRDGSLGSGDSLTATLTVGQHMIALQATDSDALTATTAITVEILADFDRDGLSDTYEENQGVLDWWNSDDGGADSDGDGLTNRSEAAWGTDPAKADTDGDGIPDNEEITGGSSPLDRGNQPQAPELFASAVELNFAAMVNGANPESEEILLLSSTPAVLTWTVSVDVPWLSTQAVSGTTPSIIAVDVDTSGLSAANYTGQVFFQSGDSELTIPVRLAVVDHTSQLHSMFLPLIIRGL